MSIIRFILIFIAIIFFLMVIIQFIPVDRTNPPVQADIITSDEVYTILKRACYDCHSNETQWHTYSKIAPISWLISKDVNKGREELNFSDWEFFSNKEKVKAKKSIWEEIQEGKMPLRIYVFFHPNAKLTTDDLEILKKWVMEE